MARRSLRPQLNQIRAWVRQGRTDAWIAHQLEISATELSDFRRQHDLNAEEDETAEADLRDEIEAEIEAAQERELDEEEEIDEADDEAGGEADDELEAGETDAGGDGQEPAERDEEPRGRRRRGRRGGRGRGRGRGGKGGALEATFDHGEKEGFGLWLDPAVQDNPAYGEHWAGHRAVQVTIEPDRIVITRAGNGDGD
jgi:hypothetical protein